METITQKVWSRVKGQKRGTKKKLESHFGTWKADKMERKRKETKCEKERTRSTIGRKEERQKVGQSVSLPRSALKREEEGSFFQTHQFSPLLSRHTSVFPSIAIIDGPLIYFPEICWRVDISYRSSRSTKPLQRTTIVPLGVRSRGWVWLC